VVTDPGIAEIPVNLGFPYPVVNASRNVRLENSSVAGPDPGSGIRCLFDPGPGSGIRIGFFSGSWIPTPYFLELSDKVLGRKFYNSLKTGPNFFLQHLKNKIIFSFVKFVATKKGLTTNFFSPFSFVAVFASGIRDPGSGMGKNQDPGSGLGKNQDPGSGINIPDPQHWKTVKKFDSLIIVI
jgi:hypothetical protein